MTHEGITYFTPSGEWSEPHQCILIVDDEPNMRSSLRALLEGHGRDILECATGNDALITLKSQHIDLVLLDINLPDISGLDVMEWIASNQIVTSVIMVSADVHFNSAVRALRSGAVEFVRKQFDMDEIQQRVTSVLHRRHLEHLHLLMTAQLEKSERLHRFLVESSPDFIYTLDPEGRFTFVNSRVESLLGYSREELIGRNFSVIVHDDDLEQAVYSFSERCSDDRSSTNIEIRLSCNIHSNLRCENASIVAVLSSMGMYESENKSESTEVHSLRFLGTYGVARDVTDRKLAEETIGFQAMHDHLTHLPNRKLFRDRLEMSIVQAKRNSKMLGVMFIDLDRFKLVNDTFGHAEGDDLLKNVAQRLLSCVRASDTLARQGGDEFTILLPDLIHAEDATVIANKIQDSLSIPFTVAGEEFRATASVGISIFPRDGESADLLLKNADIAMYSVKDHGKNGFMFFAGEMNSCYHERVRFEYELLQAIKNSEFELHYQPQIHVTSSRIVGLEALVRWRHPLHGLLNPASFIDMAEDLGLINAITDWVLDEACRQLVNWRAMGMKELRIAVNISPQEFNNQNVVERIVSCLDRYRLPEHVLDVEITENLLLEDDAGVLDKLRQLRERGIRISIDDFGTRHSSLNYLRRITVNAIKIDKSFVRDLVENFEPSPIILAIIEIARGYSLSIMVEGVETNYQMRTLQELGCEDMQGYLFSKPLPADEVEQLLLDSDKMPTLHQYTQQSLSYFGDTSV